MKTRAPFLCLTASFFLAVSISGTVHALENKDVPDTYDAQSAAGLAYLKQTGEENLDKAITHLEKAASLAPKESGVYVNLGVAYSQKGRIEDAVIALQQSLEIEPNNLNAFLNLGTVYEQDGWFEAADQCFKQAKMLAPNSPLIQQFFSKKDSFLRSQDSSKKSDSFIKQGLGPFQTGQYAIALKFFQQAAEVNKSSPAPRINIGNAYLRMGQHEKAEEAYKLAVQLAPRNSMARYSLGNYYTVKQLWKDAIREFERAEALGFGHVNLYSGLAKAYILEKQFQKAEISLNKLLKLAPSDPNGWYLLGITYVQLNNGWKAREAFKKCVEYEPGHADAHYELGWLYASYDSEYARKELKTALKLNPSHEQAREELEKLAQENRP